MPGRNLIFLETLIKDYEARLSAGYTLSLEDIKEIDQKIPERERYGKIKEVDIQGEEAFCKGDYARAVLYRIHTAKGFGAIGRHIESLYALLGVSKSLKMLGFQEFAEHYLERAAEKYLDIMQHNHRIPKSRLPRRMRILAWEIENDRLRLGITELDNCSEVLREFLAAPRPKNKSTGS